MPELDIGISLPTISEIETPGIGGIGAGARHVERLGLDSVWAPDLITGDGAPSLEATIALGNDGTARDALLRSLVDDHGMPPAEAAMIPITGSPAEVAERFAAYAEAGAERLVIALGGKDWMRHCELIAEAHALLG